MALALLAALGCASGDTPGAAPRADAPSAPADPSKRVVTGEELDQTGQPTTGAALCRTPQGIWVRNCR